MLVKLLTSRATADTVDRPGDEINVPDAEGKRMVLDGLAEPVAVAPVQRAGTRSKPKAKPTQRKRS